MNMSLSRIFSPLALATVMAAGLASCTEDSLTDKPQTPEGDAVTFAVRSATDSSADPAEGAPATRSTIATTTPATQPAQRFALESSDGMAAELVETTLPIIDHEGDIFGDATARRSRAQILTSIPSNFSTIGYRGAAATSITATPWFHNEETSSAGVLTRTQYWATSEPYGRFYAVFPQVSASNSHLTLSPADYTSTPYVDFQVENEVTNQVDLMTAHSGVITYDQSGVAPVVPLHFKHALTGIRFKVGSNLSRDKIITSITIAGAAGKGRYTLATDAAEGTWSNLAPAGEFTLSGVNISTKEAVNNIIAGKTGDNYTFWMIPQDVSNVTVAVQFNDGSSVRARLKGTWLAGTTKTYTLSEPNSTWAYELSAISPAVAEYSDVSTGNYSILSYRIAPDSVKEAVAWQVVGYDANNDGTFSLTEKPDWLTSLSASQGVGGITAQTGTAGLRVEALTDKIGDRNNQLKTAAAKGSADNYYDLSTKGGSAPRSTANSYLISSPGYYKLPLVYGNAITNGNTNASAYKSANTGTNILTNFQDHAGKNITNPWITLSNGGVNAPDGVKLVWADESGLVTDLSVVGSGENAYLQFTVPQAALKQGNAVVAATKGGVVVWSWHLWFAPADALSTIPVTNFQSKVYNFTKETLGWKYTKWMATPYSSPRSVKVKVEQTVANNGVKQAAVITIIQKNGQQRQGYSTLYQFGRKDAFAGIVPTEGSITTDSGNNISIINSIQNPNTFYTQGTAWTMNFNQLNLWSANNTVVGNNDNPVIKTVYDPSPAGFKIPASNAFTGFTTDGKNGGPMNVDGAWDNGWNFKNKIKDSDATIYFPTAPYRRNDTGVVISLNSTVVGYYWTAIPAQGGAGPSNAERMHFGNSAVNPWQAVDRIFGFSVRPAAE